MATRRLLRFSPSGSDQRGASGAGVQVPNVKSDLDLKLGRHEGSSNKQTSQRRDFMEQQLQDLDQDQDQDQDPTPRARILILELDFTLDLNQFICS
ncbi:uncharacterized protein V6R79_013802 [Siganus canaliculatus]